MDNITFNVEHIGVYFHDLEKARDFFEKYFQVKVSNLYHNKATTFKSYFLTFANGARLEIMTRDNLESCMFDKAYYAGSFHIAFSVGSKEAVDNFTKSIMNAGFKVTSGPRTTGDGYYESCFIGPEGISIEITV